MKTVVLIVFLFAFFDGFGQTNSICDTIYTPTDVMAEYDGGIKGLMNYIHDTLAPIVGKCMDQGDPIIGSLRVHFTIDNTGNVINVDFPRQELSVSCEKNLRSELLKMKGWTPGQIAGKPVCTKYYLPISCLKWQ